ncbi:toll-like receptor 13 [Liolophura sinensis]|uniref:toll-like receptor 13 n=1 Tax=Liolophura sinensis TaxID=3198878 RepID=UPI0031593BE2
MPLLLELVIFILMCCCRNLSATSNHRQCHFNQIEHYLNCSSKRLQYVPSEEFSSDILGIDLSSNKITKVQNWTFSNVPALVFLDLSSNLIHTIESTAFDGLSKLLSLNISNNQFYLSVFKAKLFEPLVSLKEIRLHKYLKSKSTQEWENIDEAFGKLKNLTRLYMDFPPDFRFGDGFGNLTKLIAISTSNDLSEQSHCDIRSIHNTTFEVFRNTSLRELRLFQCNISSFDIASFEPLSSLEVLDLSYNMNAGLLAGYNSLYGLQGRNMSEIKLGLLNNFTNFLYAFLLAPSLKHIDISHGYSFPESRGYHIPKALSLNYSLAVPLPPNLETLNISSFGIWFYVNLKSKFIFASKLRYLVSSYVNLDNCDGQSVFGMDNLTHLDISGILCEAISPEYFRSFPHLVQLSLSNSPYIKTALMTQTPFVLLEELEEIDLSGNKLIGLHPRLFEQNKRLRKINLANNKFQALPTTLSSIVILQQLDLSANVFTDLSEEEMKIFDRWMIRNDKGKSFSLLFAGNNLQCTCETVLFIHWLHERRNNIDYQRDYDCFLSNGSRTSVHRFAKHLTNFEVKCVSETYLVISVVSSLTLVLLVLLLAATYRYRSNLRYWLYTRLQPPENMFSSGLEYVYDAFVAYSSVDYDWIYGQLRPNLQGTDDDPIRLCIHDRDFTPGKPIHENIVDTIRKSRKILLVISKGFLESRYGPLEIEYAGMKSLDEGKDNIILCVLMEDIPVRRMPKALRNLWHKITFLKWTSNPEEQTIFWRNLKSALNSC